MLLGSHEVTARYFVYPVFGLRPIMVNRPSLFKRPNRDDWILIIHGRVPAFQRKNQNRLPAITVPSWEITRGHGPPNNRQSFWWRSSISNPNCPVEVEVGWWTSPDGEHGDLSVVSADRESRHLPGQVSMGSASCYSLGPSTRGKRLEGYPTAGFS